MPQLISATWTLGPVGLQLHWGFRIIQAGTTPTLWNMVSRHLWELPALLRSLMVGHWSVKARPGPARPRPAGAWACSVGRKGKKWCGARQSQEPTSGTRRAQGTSEQLLLLCTERSWQRRGGLLGSDHKNGSLRMRGRKRGDHMGIRFPTCSLEGHVCRSQAVLDPGPWRGGFLGAFFRKPLSGRGGKRQTRVPAGKGSSLLRGVRWELPLVGRAKCLAVDWLSDEHVT